jgi:hypothetical protein
MMIVKLKNGMEVNVVAAEERQSVVSSRDAEMDARAVQAVKDAINKAEFCKKPIAKYDMETKKVYIQYADGKIKYVE